MNAPTKPSPAEVYESFLVPGVFVPSTRELLAVAAPRAADRVLDLACGTGIVARTLAPVVGERNLVGVDIAPPMLEVARAVAPGIDWRLGNAVALDLPSGSFDLVVCQHGIQFFPDRPAACREMRRVLAGDGRAVIAAWTPLARQPFVKPMMAAVQRHLGAPEAVLGVPFSVGPDDLRALLQDAGFATVEVTEHTLRVRFPSAKQYVRMSMMGAAAVIPHLQGQDLEPLVAAVEHDVADLLEQHRDGEGVAFEEHMSVAIARV